MMSSKQIILAGKSNKSQAVNSDKFSLTHQVPNKQQVQYGDKIKIFMSKYGEYQIQKASYLLSTKRWLYRNSQV